MTTLEHPVRPPGVGRRLAALAVAGTVVVGTVTVGAAPASAAPQAIDGATLTWGLSTEMQSAPPFGGCNYLSAGASDGTQASYQTSAGDVTVLKDGAAPTWANKCTGAPSKAVNQEVVWSGGTGTVDPASGEVELNFTGRLSVNFYGGLVPFTIENPVVTVGADGRGRVVATLFGYGSSIENPNVKVPLDPVDGVVVADLSDVDAGSDTGFTVTPDYAGVEYEPPAGSGGTPQNRTGAGWGSWPSSWVDFHYETGLTSYWYSSGGAADPYKAPSALTISYQGGSGGGDPVPSEGQQSISVTVPETAEPGEFLWSIDGDQAVNLGETTDQGTHLQATGAIDPISVTDTRAGGPEWSISGQVSDFTGGLSGGYLGWNPRVLTAGAGAVAGDAVTSSITGGAGLSESSALATAPNGHASGTASIGADLDLRLPVDTAPGSYTTILTITALS
ncbi:hypothetical protein [Micromonospora sp. WMMD1082]|uniref:hypothetical protein n=1 Tax=Micromonospora sp. WMMD1082 TaxID=3016104 RepID=UPI0024176974|nr:hypothetical protein [Micromonospora sp. WMMD1082]MDG4792754.1 hypothetical protein [Micromonospora sp. WMMD1082]